MINYKFYQNNRSNSHYPGKWYARATHSQTLGLEDLSAHMASHNCGFSKGQIQGILTDMVGCIRELIRDGKSVKIPDLGIFYPSLKTKPADSVAAFNVKENIASVRGRMPQHRSHALIATYRRTRGRGTCIYGRHSQAGQ